jgi:selenocysteine-specific elongation factor
VNLSGVNIDRVKRGDVIAYPGSYQPTQRIDVRFRLLPDVVHSLKHNSQVKLFLGAAEILSRVRLLGSDELSAGEEGWLQLELDAPLVTIKGDRYILRRPSPGETLGGGFVVDPHPKRRHKRFSEVELANLDTLARGTPGEILLQAFVALGIASLKDVTVRSNLDPEAAHNAAQDLIATGQVIVLENDPQDSISPLTLLTSKLHWDQLSRQALLIVDDYHKTYPLRRGISREELKSRLKLSPRVYNVILRRIVSIGELAENGSLVQRVGHTIRFTSLQQRSVDDLLAKFIASPFSPPTVKECQAEVGEDTFTAMVELGLIIPIPPDVVFRKQDYDLMLSDVIDMLKSRGKITAAEVRDHFNTSRRYVLALLEHMDAQGITVREGDLRRLK